MTNMRKKNHLPLFRDDLSTFDDFFQSTEKPIVTNRLIATTELSKKDVAFSSKLPTITNVLTVTKNKEISEISFLDQF